MSDTQFLLGKLVQGDPERDAIHIAVVAVEAEAGFVPGERVGLTFGGKASRAAPKIIGIVDPFLTERVRPGDKFWMFLLPNTITSLKHNWSHPDFPESREKMMAEAWLRNFAAQNFTEYDYLIQCAKSGDDICFGNEQDDLNNDADLRKQLWDNLELVTGQKMTGEQRATEWFRCACCAA